MKVVFIARARAIGTFASVTPSRWAPLVSQEIGRGGKWGWIELAYIRPKGVLAPPKVPLSPVYFLASARAP